jgi:hypothetical protein
LLNCITRQQERHLQPRITSFGLLGKTKAWQPSFTHQQLQLSPHYQQLQLSLSTSAAAVITEPEATHIGTIKAATDVNKHITAEAVIITQPLQLSLPRQDLHPSTLYKQQQLLSPHERLKLSLYSTPAAVAVTTRTGAASVTNIQTAKAVTTTVHEQLQLLLSHQQLNQFDLYGLPFLMCQSFLKIIFYYIYS